jgi:anti-anti-sigma regulatory factor
MTSPATTDRNARCTKTSSPEGDVLTIVGEIEDATELASNADGVGKNVIVDIGGVTFINSVGVREWVTLLDKLAAKGSSVTLRNVSEPMVRQMTMVIEARGDAKVVSFFAPYVCNNCGEERALLVDVNKHADALTNMMPPKLSCPACGGEAELDEFPNRYLSFLT